MPIPRLYPIIDAGLLLRADLSLESFARELHDAGIRFLQYRDKDSPDHEVLAHAVWLRRIFPSAESCLILNDRVSLVGAASFDGVHVGQDDVSPAEARAIMGRNTLLGVSTHNQEQVENAARGEADYLAIGPIFPTASKLNPDPAIGLEGIRAARKATGKSLVAIGGITRTNCRSVLEAGADSIAVISDLLPGAGDSTRNRIQEFLRQAAEPG